MSRPPTPVGRGWVGDGPGEGRDRMQARAGRHRADTPEPRAPQVTERDMPDLSEVRARHQTAAMAGEHAHHAGGFDTSTAAALTRSWQDVSDLHDSLRVLAVDLLALAATAGVPSSYWYSDRRIKRALAVLDVTPEQALQINWAEAFAEH